MSAEQVISTSTVNDSYAQSLEQDIAELQHLSTQAQRPSVKNVLETQLKLFKTKLEEEYKKIKAANEKKEVPVSHSSKQIIDYESISSYAWDEDDNFVNIYILLEGVPPVHTHYTERGFAIAIHDYKGKNLKLTINNLYKELDKSNCKEFVGAKSIKIKLKKKQSGKWNKLIATNEDIKKESSANSSDPGAGLMNMMKTLYDDGDEEMKKLIAKTWVESQDKSRKGGGGDLGAGGF